MSTDIDNEQANIEATEPLERAVRCGFCFRRPAKGMLRDPKRIPEYVRICECCHHRALFGKKLRWPVLPGDAK